MSRRESTTKRNVPKKKERTEVEYLRGQNRALRKENGQLKRRLKTLEKRENYFDDVALEPDDAEIFEIESLRKPKCPSCNKGELVHYYVVGRSWDECSQCDYRTKTVIDGK